MLLKPKIDYGSEVYTSAEESYLKTVYAIQHSAIRIATGAYRSSPVNSLHSDSGIKPYKYYNEIKMLKLLYTHCIQSVSSTILPDKWRTCT